MTETILLADTDDWADFADANQDALLDMYESLDDAFMAACQGGIEIGGGAAPHFYIRFAD